MGVKILSSLHMVASGFPTASGVKATECGEGNLGLLPVGAGISLGIPTASVYRNVFRDEIAKLRAGK